MENQRRFQFILIEEPIGLLKVLIQGKIMQ